MEEMLAFVEIRNQGQTKKKDKVVDHNKFYELSLIKDENGDYDVKTRYGRISNKGKGGTCKSLKGARSCSQHAAWRALMTQLNKKMSKRGYKFVECEVEEEWMEEDIVRGYASHKAMAVDNGLAEILAHRSF